MTRHKALLLFTLLVGGCLLLSGCMGTGIPMGWSGPVVDNDILYVGTAEGKVVSYTLLTDLGIAVEWWRYPRRGDPGLGSGGGGGFLACAPAASAGIYTNPLVDAGMVYIGSYEGKVYALNSSSREAGYSFPQEVKGEWVYPEEDSIGPIVGSPEVADGTLYIGSSDGNLYAIDTTTGELAWDSPFSTEDRIWAKPVVNNSVVYIGSYDGQLYAVDATDGTLVWESPFEAGGAVSATPLIHNETIYIGSFDRKFHAIDVNTGEAKEGFIPFEANNWFWGKALAYDNIVIAGCLDGRVYALDAGSGEMKWSFPELEEDPVGKIRGDPIMVNEMVVFGSEDGRVYALDAASGREIWHSPIGEDFFGPIRSSLYAGDGQVYVHDTQNSVIYALGVVDGNIEPGWPVSTGE